MTTETFSRPLVVLVGQSMGAQVAELAARSIGDVRALVPLDLSGGPSTTSNNILRPADAPGGMKVEVNSYAGPDASGLK